MSYLVQADISNNMMLVARISQCAAEQHIENPDQWTSTNRRTWAAAPGWADAWASAHASHEDNPSYDPGKDESVITDAMILGQVQAMVSPPAAP